MSNTPADKVSDKSILLSQQFAEFEKFENTLKKIEEFLKESRENYLNSNDKFVQLMIYTKEELYACYNFGNYFKNQGQIDEAINFYQKALQVIPEFSGPFNDIGDLLKDNGQFDHAKFCFQQAVQLNSENASAHWNLSRLLLFSGNFKEGWKEYEWRFNAFPSIYQNRNFSIPLREGSDISGLTVLLFSEQGFGDTIQFVRYAPLVAKRGAKVILECQKELVSLLQTVEGIHKVIVHGSELPEFDVYWPLLSSPLFFDTNLENIPQKIPYITPDNLLVEKFHNRVQNDKAKLKIGLSWAGRPTHSNDIFRSVSLDLFSPLAQIEDVTLYSLQKGEAAKQVEIKSIGWKIIDYNNEINDFSDTAGLIANLDLVISVDTAVTHLTGALGKPVWTLLPFIPDWRWMLERKDSPWYPTMRLFRQPSHGDWGSVIANIKKALKEMILL